jgi:hypothetical protein
MLCVVTLGLSTVKSQPRTSEGMSNLGHTCIHEGSLPGRRGGNPRQPLVFQDQLGREPMAPAQKPRGGDPHPWS